MSYISRGVHSNPGVTGLAPTVTRIAPLQGSATSCEVYLHDNANYTGPIRKYIVPAATFFVTDNSPNYLYIDYNNGSPIYACTTNVAQINGSSNTGVNTLLVTNDNFHFTPWDSIGDGLPSKLMNRFLKTERYAYGSGLDLSQTGGIAKIASGRAWLGAVEFVLGNVFSDGSNSSTWFFYYHSGGAWTSTVPGPAFNYTQYDNGTNLVALTGNRCTINWVFRGVEDGNHGYYVVGNKEYKDLPTAIAETKLPALPADISTHAILVGRIICQNAVAVPLLIEGAFGSSFTGTVLNEHNDLSGLQGGTVEEYYHLTSTEYGLLDDFAAFPVDIDRNGFLNQTETTIAFDGVSVFTLAPAVADWSYYRAGVKYTITGSKTIDLLTVENPLVDGHRYFIYINANDGTLSASLTAWTLQDATIPVAILAWDNTATPKYLLQEERHSCLIDRRTHLYLHNTQGTKYVTGGDLTGWTATTNSDAANTFQIGQAVIADEDIYQTLPQINDGNGTDPSNYLITYRTSPSTWTWSRSDMPFKYTPGGYINWDNAGTLTQGSGGNGGSARYYNTYLVLTNTKGEGRFVFVPGQNEYTTAALAYGETFNSLTLTNFPKVEWVALYQFTWYAGVSGLTNKGKVQLTRAPQPIGVSAITAAATGAIAHNSTTGLQGGSANQYYHLTETQYTNVSSLVQNVFISPTAPVSPPSTYMWVQTQIGPENNFTIWIEDGV